LIALEDSVGQDQIDHDWYQIATTAPPDDPAEIDSMIYTYQTVVLNQDSAYCRGCELVIHHRRIESDVLPTLRMYRNGDDDFFEISALNDFSGAKMEIVGGAGFSYRGFGENDAFRVHGGAIEGGFQLLSEGNGIFNSEYGDGTFDNNDIT